MPSISKVTVRICQRCYLRVVLISGCGSLWILGVLERGGEVELLEYLSGKIGCMYLSDLRLSRNRLFLINCVQRLNPNDFPLKDWQDAVEYLFEYAPHFQTVEAARDYISRCRGDESMEVLRHMEER